MVTLIGSTLAVSTFAWMLLGKHLSRTPGRLVPNMVVYLFLYSIVAPLWLIRSVSHVARGVSTAWR